MHDASLIVFTGIGALLLLMPLPLQWRARNSGTLLLITWLFLGNLLVFINCIVWWDSYSNPAPIWCDIVSKILVGLPVGISASSLCITRRLVMIASSSTVAISQTKKRRALFIDLFLGVILPMLVMALHYTAQPHRFDIFEGYGCQISTRPSVASVFAVTLWTPVITIIAAIYGIVAIKLFLSRRLQFQTILKSSRSGLDNRHYIRLLALASVDIVIGLPFTLFGLVKDIQQRMSYPSWQWVHANWSRVDIYQADQYMASGAIITNLMLPRWLPALLAIIFFLFFGVSTDAIGEYSRWLHWLHEHCGLASSSRREQLPMVIPKLGSTVVQPLGDTKDGILGDEDLAKDNERVEPLSPITSGVAKRVAVAVSVERDIV
ncbi:hypothetical protein IAT40_004891 [Kwoniella sp. CBS 6097]